MRPNGYVLWEGGSPHDKRPVVAIATGFVRKSKNPKTGPMIQVSLMRRDVSPDRAVMTGADKSVCNDCELRQFTVKRLSEKLGLLPGEKPPMCYVTTSQGILGAWMAYKAGTYPKLRRRAFEFAFGGRVTRLGAYGNFSNAPLWLTEKVVGASDGWTLYEHNWRAEHAQPLRRYAMASVSSEADKAQANALGWRTFRVKQAGEPALEDEVICPASAESGYKTDCYHCQLCCGTALGAKNVVINDHGPTRHRDRALLKLGLKQA